MGGSRFLRQLFFLGGLLLLLTQSACSKEDTKAQMERWLFTELSELAERGEPNAQYHLGMMLNNGTATQQDLPRALHWFTKSYESGNPLAAYKLGCYYGGQFPGLVPVDEQRSLQYKLIAAEAGYSLAQNDVAVAYLQLGRTDLAMKWWHLAAEQGFFMSLKSLSILHYKGQLAPRDHGLAYKYFLLAVKQSGLQLGNEAEDYRDLLKTELSEVELQRVETEAAAWTPKPSALTLRAKAGLDDAVALVWRTKANN